VYRWRGRCSLAGAREIVGERPDETAIYLAALVALDIGAPDDD
jgi:hypothetical protein